MTLQEICMLTKEEVNDIVDSGMFNSIIKGYVLLAQDNGDISLSELLDIYSADDARTRFERSY